MNGPYTFLSVFYLIVSLNLRFDKSEPAGKAVALEKNFNKSHEHSTKGTFLLHFTLLKVQIAHELLIQLTDALRCNAVQCDRSQEIGHS